MIDLLFYYGFGKTAERENGEFFLEKVIVKGPLLPHAEKDFFTLDRHCYPRFYDGDNVRKFCVPIRPDYHRKLFPEIAILADRLPLFDAPEFEPVLMYGPRGNRTPGNTIRKVYICRSKTNSLQPGDLLFFYMSKDDQFQASQSITSVGIVEQVNQAETIDDLLRLTAKRSVFTADELVDMVRERLSALKVIDFLLVGHLDPGIPLDTLLLDGIFHNWPPQSILEFSPERYSELRRHMNLGFEL